MVCGEKRTGSSSSEQQGVMHADFPAEVRETGLTWLNPALFIDLKCKRILQWEVMQIYGCLKNINMKL